MKIKIILGICLLALSNSCFSMGTHSSFFSKAGSYAKSNSGKIIASTFPVGLTGISVAFLMDRALNSSEYSDLDYEFRVDQKTRDEINSIRPFIDKRLEEHGLDPLKIKIRFQEEGRNYSANYDDTLYVFRSDFCMAGFFNRPGDWYTFTDAKGKLVESWSYGDNLTEKEKVRKQEEILAVIDHEISHLKRNDEKRACLIKSGFCASNLIATYRLLKEVPSKRLQTGLTVVSTVPLYAANRVMSLVYNRHCEKIADANIQDKEEFLEGAVRWFDRSLQFEKAAIEIGLEPDPQSFKGKIDYYWSASHPTWESRIDRLQKRLERLENKK